MQSGLNRTRTITYTALLVALAASLRLIKTMLFTSFQFVNFIALFAIIAGVLFGAYFGMTVGFTSWILSDMMIGWAGYWTPVMAVFMAFIGLMGWLLWGRRRNIQYSKMGLGIGIFILILIVDILDSWVLNLMIGFPWDRALTVGIAGLFIPAGAGYMLAPGPITEATTAILAVTIIQTLQKTRIISGIKLSTKPNPNIERS